MKLIENKSDLSKLSTSSEPSIVKFIENQSEYLSKVTLYHLKKHTTRRSRRACEPTESLYLCNPVSHWASVSSTWWNLFNQTAVPRKERAYFGHNEEIRASAFTGLMAQDKTASVLCIYVKTIRAKQAKVSFAYFVRCGQHGIIAKHLNVTNKKF